MYEQVVVVALSLNGGQKELMDLLPRPDGDPLVSWWIAEDERYDGSDCDSAVFVTPGYQKAARKLLQAFGMTSQDYVNRRLRIDPGEALSMTVSALEMAADEEEARDDGISDEIPDEDFITEARGTSAMLLFARAALPETPWKHTPADGAGAPGVVTLPAETATNAAKGIRTMLSVYNGSPAFVDAMRRYADMLDRTEKEATHGE